MTALVFLFMRGMMIMIRKGQGKHPTLNSLY